VKRLEAICDAVARYHDYWEPESEAYGLRNPGLLQCDMGKRVFSCHRAGYAALIDKVHKYCSMNQDATVVSLLDFIGIKMKMQQEQAIDFASRCANSTLKANTNLKWFLGEDSNG
jgi:hypothetical protein